jgi:hypothetical protein
MAEGGGGGGTRVPHRVDKKFIIFGLTKKSHAVHLEFQSTFLHEISFSNFIIIDKISKFYVDFFHFTVVFVRWT